jgi:hypothetical protein
MGVVLTSLASAGTESGDSPKDKARKLIACGPLSSS